MPRCGATFNNNVPPWARGDFRGVLNAGTNPSPAHRATHRPEEIFKAPRLSRQHLLHNIAGNVCQPELAAHMFVGESCMVKAEAM